jgi:hypothetical protein
MMIFEILAVFLLPGVVVLLTVGVGLRIHHLSAISFVVAAILACISFLALYAVSIDWRDANGVIDCEPYCTDWQDAIGAVLWNAGVAAILLFFIGLITAIVSLRPRYR